jgi:uncharacterized protein (TIGR03435 family)
MALYAYDLKPYELRPAVSTAANQFNLDARVPCGCETAGQVKVMLRNLLAERFKLAFHREKAKIDGYALIVAKSGLKMKESVPDSSPVSPWAPEPIKDADGFVYTPIRNVIAMAVRPNLAWPGTANGLMRWVGSNVPMTQAFACLTGLLDSLTGRPVIDGTGLKGKYDFILTFSSDSAGQSGQYLGSGWSRPYGYPTPSDDRGATPSGDGGLTVFGALEKQLGLKLEPTKITVNLFVIDHAEKTPVEH